MAAYLVAQTRVHDPERYRQYTRATAEVLPLFGGRVLAATNEVAELEGRHEGQYVVVIEFDALETVHRFWQSEEYARAKRFREGAATVTAYAVPGR